MEARPVFSKGSKQHVNHDKRARHLHKRSGVTTMQRFQHAMHFIREVRRAIVLFEPLHLP